MEREDAIDRVPQDGEALHLVEEKSAVDDGDVPAHARMGGDVSLQYGRAVVNIFSRIDRNPAYSGIRKYIFKKSYDRCARSLWNMPEKDWGELCY